MPAGTDSRGYIEIMNFLRTPGLLVLILAFAGCGEKPETLYPVAGKVTLNGEPVTKGTIGFIPDLAKGNASVYTPQGKIGPDGSYTLYTLDRPGAAPGHYRITVWSMANEPPPESYQATKDFKPQWLVPLKYTQADTTDLAREVVASPTQDAYDLQLAK